jgi:BirA family biotin operon repressor/biotin-[acetyl-CoA-carboxylase] ligase
MDSQRSGWRLQTHSVLESTQDVAIAAATSGDPGRLAILADEQTNGRGSRGRAWAGATGNLYFSGLFRPWNLSPQPGFWALLAGVVLHDAVTSAVPDPVRLKLKWPNDLLRDGAKLGGILIDSALAPTGLLDWVVIGMGVNLRTAPVLEGRNTTSLADMAVTPAALASRILATFDRWIDRPLPELRDAWLDRAHPIGTWLDITTGAQRHTGAFAGLADDGALLLSTHAAPITVGDVFLSRAGAAHAPCR